MATGTVKWFNNAKGYGFILPENGSADLFAHYSSIQMEGYRTLKAGQVVTFDEVEGPKGGHAANIRTLEATDGQQSPATDHQEPSEAFQESAVIQQSEVAESSSLMPMESALTEEIAEPH